MPSIVSTIVEVCIFRFIGDRPEFLLLKRAPDERLYPGIWQLVTGTIEPGETATQAALREVLEETGFSPRVLWSVPFINSFHDPHLDVINLTTFFAAQVDTH